MSARNVYGGLTGSDYMILAAARLIRSGECAFVGVGLPGSVAFLARELNEEQSTLFYESGCIDSSPSFPPLSVADAELAETALVIVPTHEIFNYWVQAGRIDVGVLGAAQIDKFGNINTTVIGDYRKPNVRLPGAGGATTIAGFAKRTLAVIAHSNRAFVERVDFITTPGVCDRDGGQSRRSMGVMGAGVNAIITDMGVLEPNAQMTEFELVQTHPGITTDDVRHATGWDLVVGSGARVTPNATSSEIEKLHHLNRALRYRDEEAHSVGSFPRVDASLDAQQISKVNHE